MIGPVAHRHVPGEGRRRCPGLQWLPTLARRAPRARRPSAGCRRRCEVTSAAALGAAVDGDELADPVAVADARLGALALVLQVLRRDADACEYGKKMLSSPIQVGPST